MPYSPSKGNEVHIGSSVIRPITVPRHGLIHDALPSPYAPSRPPFDPDKYPGLKLLDDFLAALDVARGAEKEGDDGEPTRDSE
jgi:hypothetical protein